jgi:luciferase-like monooxygenase
MTVAQAGRPAAGARPGTGRAGYLRVALLPRPGSRPATTVPDRPDQDPATFFHRQLSQTAPVPLQDELARRIAALDGIVVAHSAISVPGARGFFLAPQAGRGPAAAFMTGREFAHLHPAQDGSMHAALPGPMRAAALAAGWAQPHPLVGTPMVFGPRDAAELEVIWQIFLASYRYAAGLEDDQAADPDGAPAAGPGGDPP